MAQSALGGASTEIVLFEDSAQSFRLEFPSNIGRIGRRGSGRKGPFIRGVLVFQAVSVFSAAVDPPAPALSHSGRDR